MRVTSLTRTPRVVIALTVFTLTACSSNSGIESQRSTTTVRARNLPSSTDESAYERTTTTAAPVTDASLPNADRPREPVVTVNDAARDPRDSAGCDPEQPAVSMVTLSWKPSGEAEQLVAIATRADGFDGGRYTVSGPLPPGTTAYRVRALEPGGVYYWRVLTRRGDVWAASPVRTFVGPTCVMDSP
jgi:hypothetical protein